MYSPQLARMNKRHIRNWKNDPLYRWQRTPGVATIPKEHVQRVDAPSPTAYTPQRTLAYCSPCRAWVKTIEWDRHNRMWHQHETTRQYAPATVIPRARALATVTATTAIVVYEPPQRAIIVCE